MGNKLDVNKINSHPSHNGYHQPPHVVDVPSMSTISFDVEHNIIHKIRATSGSFANSELFPKSILIRKQRSIIPPEKVQGDKATSIELAGLLIFGYCRLMEYNLDSIIPLTIIELFMEFYYISKIVICLSEGNDIRGANLNGLFMTDIDNDTNWKLNVYELNEKKNLKITTENEWKWVIDSSAICYKQNIKQYLNKNIFNKIEILFHHNQMNKNINKYKYNAIFKCGGIKTDGLNSNYSNAIIMADGEMKAWNWELPRLPYYLHGNELIFSDKNGLFSIGGQDDDGDIIKGIYNLQLITNNDDDNGDDEWKWNKTTDLNVAVSKSSCCLINNFGAREERLFIVGGQTSMIGPQNKTQIYSFNDKHWSFGQMSTISRFEGGIYYDRYMQRVYFCGGKDKDEADKLTNYNEYYEIERDIWLNQGIPPICLGTKPLIWTEGDLLYTASFLNYGFSMQYIDLRINNKQWSVQENKNNKNNNNHKHLSHVPYPQAICRLLM